MDAIQRRGAGGRGIHGITGALQTAAQEVGDSLFVLDDQDSHVISA
jgi:hypothetical protein